MAAKEKKGGGDFILESRHLVGLFMLLVVIFAVVFTLGYLMGRSQYDSRLRAVIGSPPQDDPPAAASALKSKAKSQRPETNTSSAPIPPKPSVSVTSTPPKTGAVSTGSPLKGDAAPAQKNPDWDFYHSAEPKTTEDHLQPPQKTVAAAPPAAPKPAAVSLKPVAQQSAPAGTPLVANGAIMLQVAAVQREGDAMALAQALQQKKFPAYVITPGTDKYYRVQVGPYRDNQSATNARHDLEANGFKSIIKR
jgi:septal ring-binding cell division protein DamX